MSKINDSRVLHTASYDHRMILCNKITEMEREAAVARARVTWVVCADVGTCTWTEPGRATYTAQYIHISP